MYDKTQHVFDSVSRSIELLGGMNRFVQPGMKVLLKCNLPSAKPEEAATTHPEIAAAVAGLVKEAGVFHTVTAREVVYTAGFKARLPCLWYGGDCLMIKSSLTIMWMQWKSPIEGKIIKT